MALYGVRLVINLFDLCIYRRYLEEFIGNRKTSMEFSVLLLIVCELIGSAVNQMGISWLNFVTMVAILCVYVCQYEAGILSRLIAVLLYMGIMGVAEPLGYLFNKAFMEKVLDDTTVSYYFIVFFMALLKATIHHFGGFMTDITFICCPNFGSFYTFRPYCSAFCRLL